MEFSSKTLRRIRKRLFPPTLLATLLLAFAAGSAHAQSSIDPTSANPPNDPYYSPGIAGSPYGSIATPQGTNTQAGSQGEMDISSPRQQDIQPNQGVVQCVTPQGTTAYGSQCSQYGNQVRPPGAQSGTTQGRNQRPVPPPPTEFQQIVAESSGRLIPIFGASLFETPPSTFAPVDNIPVTPGYVLGPGDEIRLQIWGQVNQRGTFVIDRTGAISLPQVGTIHVAGLQFSQLNDFLKSQLSRVYRNFDLNVNLGQLRSIQVFVVGQVRQPGSYTVSSLSTLLNALFASGGPLPQGSLRDIQLKRAGETITHFDLYDLLLKGDKSEDVPLVTGDVIFIPDVGPQVAVIGSITTPGIYEVRGDTSFSQVIAFAGGLTNSAAGTQVRVERIDQHTQRSIISVDLPSPASGPVQDGDIINVNSIVSRFKDAVTLRGNVANPGRYVWREGMRISDLIPDREALITRSYYQRQNQLGRRIADNTGFLNMNGPIGADNNPTGYNPAAPTGLAGYSSPNNEGSLSLQPGANAAAAANRSAAASSGGGNSVGAAISTGDNNFLPKNDVILSAPDIDWEYAVIERQSTTDLTTSLLPFNLSKAIINKDPSQDLPLLAGDVVTIFSKADIRVPSAQQTKFVKLEGEFHGAGIYSVLPGETLRQLIVRAGGLTPDAYLFASEFSRESVRRLQRQRLQEYADELDSQITATTSINTAAALTDRDAAAAAASATSARSVVARLRQAQPTGRIVLPVKFDSAGIDAVPDIPLQDGDRFIVPKLPATVSVEGRVYNANAFLYRKGKRVRDYLGQAGGPDRLADRKRAYVLRADGSVISSQEHSFTERALFADRTFEDVVLYPGDAIIVPPIIQKGAILRSISNIANIAEGFGLAAGAINILR